MISNEACDKATTTATIEVGFRVTEMYLFNLSFTSNETFVSSFVTQNEEAPVPSVLSLSETADCCVS
jgi:hypothetical protein